METKGKYTYDYPRAALTTDCVIFGYDNTKLSILLIQRGIEPYKGKWALPGGFVHIEETTEEGAKRELKEETGLENIFIEQLYTFSDVNRDPRGRVVSVAYYALVNTTEHHPHAGDDAQKAQWFRMNDLPNLAFDHQLIIQKAIERLRGKIIYQPIGFELLPEKFTLTQLQELYEAVLHTELDKRNFRKKILSYDLLIQLNEKQKNVSHRAAWLYKFNHKKYKQLEKSGFLFEI